MPLRAAASAVTWAANGVDLREPLKPAEPADSAARKGMEHGLERVEVHAKGAGSGRDTAIRSLQAAGLQVTTVKDVTPQAHNGCRPRKRRRV